MRIVSILVVLVSVGFSAHHVVAADNVVHGNPSVVQAPADVPLSEGLVKRVNKETGKVVLSHGPLPNGMPAMTMAFRVREASWIDSMKEGQKILFAVADVNGAMTVIRFEPIK
ncbi:conserved exported hypothetical protein [Gammaproteobacteria bacterium]